MVGHAGPGPRRKCRGRGRGGANGASRSWRLLWGNDTLPDTPLRTPMWTPLFPLTLSVLISGLMLELVFPEPSIFEF